MVKTFSRGFYLSLFIEIEYIQLHGIRGIVLVDTIIFLQSHFGKSIRKKYFTRHATTSAVVNPPLYSQVGNRFNFLIVS